MEQKRVTQQLMQKNTAKFKDVKSRIDTNLNTRGQRVAGNQNEVAEPQSEEHQTAERSKMSGGSSASKPTGSTKASHRYGVEEVPTTETIHRTASQVEQQSVDRNNPMDTESEVGASEHSSTI